MKPMKMQVSLHLFTKRDKNKSTKESGIIWGGKNEFQ
jgi:hypothetical protein